MADLQTPAAEWAGPEPDLTKTPVAQVALSHMDQCDALKDTRQLCHGIRCHEQPESRRRAGSASHSKEQAQEAVFPDLWMSWPEIEACRGLTYMVAK